MKGLKTVKVSGQLLLSMVSSSNVGVALLSPSTGFASASGKLAALSDTFALYRFTKLRFEVGLNHTTGTLGTGVIGYTPEITSVAPTTASEVADLPWAHRLDFFRAIGTDLYFTNVYRDLGVDTATLQAHGVPWLRTHGTSFDDNLEYQGAIYTYTPGAGDVVVLVAHYEVEFKDFIGTGQTPRPRPPLKPASVLLPGRCQSGDTATPEKPQRMPDRVSNPPESDLARLDRLVSRIAKLRNSVGALECAEDPAVSTDK